MAELGNRAERAIEELSGNEALLEMLETDAAEELLNWGIEMVNQIADETEGMDEEAAEAKMSARLKAVRQSMRAIGNWAAGKYVEPDDREQLPARLLAHLRVVYGEGASLPSLDEIKTLLGNVDDKQNTPHELILKLKALLNETR